MSFVSSFGEAIGSVGRFVGDKVISSLGGQIAGRTERIGAAQPLDPSGTIASSIAGFAVNSAAKTQVQAIAAGVEGALADVGISGVGARIAGAAVAGTPGAFAAGVTYEVMRSQPLNVHEDNITARNIAAAAMRLTDKVHSFDHNLPANGRSERIMSKAG